MKKLQIKKRQVFLRFLISYVIILLIPIIVGSFLYRQVLLIVEKETEDKSRIIIEQSKNVTDKYLSDVDRIIKQMGFNPNVSMLSHSDGQVKGEDVYTTYITQKDLVSTSIANNFIAGYYIYFKNSDIIISKNTSYFNSQFFFTKFYRSDNYDYSQWIRTMTQTYHSQSYFPASEVDTDRGRRLVIECMQSLPVMGAGEPSGCISIFIDESSIRELLSPISEDKGGWFYIMDEKGQVITCTAEKKGLVKDIGVDLSNSKGTMDVTVGGERMMVTYAVSAQNGWKYVTVLPYRTVMAKAEHVKRITFNIVLVILSAGFVAAFAAAYQNNKPLKRILAITAGKVGIETELMGKNEYDILEGSIFKLISSNEHLKHAMQDQIVIIRATFFDRLRKGEFKSLHEVESMAAFLDINFHGSQYIVILVQLIEFADMMTVESFDELEKRRIVAKDIAFKAIEGKGYVHDVENDKLLLLVSFDINQKDAEMESCIDGMVSYISSELMNSCNSRSVYGVGTPFGSLLDVYKSFNQARQAIENRYKNKEADVFRYKQTVNEREGFYLPMEVQTRLLYLVKGGQKEEMEELLEDIYKENFSNRQLPSEMARLFIYNMVGILIRIKEQSKLKECSAYNHLFDNQYRLESHRDIREYYHTLKEEFAEVCNNAIAQKRNYNNQLIDEVIQYIDNNYTDAQLSLFLIGSHFGLSEANLSYFFKERTGNNFSTYLENLRIEHSCRLLQKRDIPINEIAGLVGYNSDNSFRRAFKRLRGVSPSDFRREKIS